MFPPMGMRWAPWVCGRAVGWKMEAALPDPSFGSCRFELVLSSSARGPAAPSSIPVTLWRADALHLLLLCELQHLPTPCCLAWTAKQLFSIYCSTAEVEHSLRWNGTSPSGPEKLACHTEIVMTDTFPGKACFVISPFYSQKKLFYQSANPQVSVLASSSQTRKTRYHKLTWNQWQSLGVRHECSVTWALSALPCPGL